MMKYVVGMDGGGTKTEVLVADLCLNPLLTFQSGAMNYNGESDDNVSRNLKDIIEKIRLKMGGLEQCAAICIGTAGVSNANAVNELIRIIRNNGYSGCLEILGDHETALCGALGKPEGIILISGTGSICYGKNAQGDSHRTGGYGYLIDDEGSGYAIGRDILTAVVRAHDGRAGETALTELVFQTKGFSTIQELVGFIYSKETNKRDIAALAALLSPACEIKDALALLILDKCTDELLKLVMPVISKLDLKEGELALSGSILEKNEMIRGSFVQKAKAVLPHVSCVLPRNNAAFGAALIACGMCRV